MSAFEKIKDELAKLRDEAKVQAHLGSMEAQREWQATEAKWDHFVSEARLHESGEGIRAAAETLADELRVAYRRLTKAL